MPAKIEVSNSEVLHWRSRYEQDGLSLAEIARENGVAKNTIRDRLIREGVKFDKGPRISRKARGRPSARMGVRLTLEQRKAIADRARGNKWCVGRIASDETRQKMRHSAKLRVRPRKVRENGDIVEPAEIDHARQKFKRVLKSLLRAAGRRKKGRTADILGYTRDELMAHVAAQFSENMSWADRASFSIDHIVPVAEFVRRDILDPRIVCSLANLRPMIPIENRRKSDKYDAANFEADLRRIETFNSLRAA